MYYILNGTQEHLIGAGHTPLTRREVVIRKNKPLMFARETDAYKYTVDHGLRECDWSPIEASELEVVWKCSIYKTGGVSNRRFQSYGVPSGVKGYSIARASTETDLNCLLTFKDLEDFHAGQQNFIKRFGGYVEDDSGYGG